MTSTGEKVDPLIGIQLGDYTIRAVIGRGGMANVYEGIDEKLDRKAAVKVMLIHHDHNDELTQRFIREARAVANLDHPNIVSVYQFGEGQNLYYLAMKLIEGKTLLSILKRLRQQKKYLEPERVKGVIDQIAAALDYAHSKGVVHRDVKPSNIMLTDDGRAFLTDFGLTMQLGDDSTLGTAFGTPRYIAPEQAIASHKAVPQSDIYSLGVVLYEMVTGQPPFDSDSPMTLALSHITHQPPPPTSLRPDLSHPVQTVILKALEKRTEMRWPSASAMADALRPAYDGVEPNVTLSDEVLEAPSDLNVEPNQSGSVVQAPVASIETITMPSTPMPRVSRRSGSRLWFTIVLALVTLLAVAGAAILLVTHDTPDFVPIVAAFNTPTSIPAARLRLIYTPDWFVIYNATGQTVSLEGVSFVRGDQPDRVFDAARFGATTYKNLGPGQCLQIWMTSATDHTLPQVCGGQTQTKPLTFIDPSVIFWAMHGDKDAVATFLVTHNRTTLQTCSVRVNTCEFSLS